MTASSTVRGKIHLNTRAVIPAERLLAVTLEPNRGGEPFSLPCVGPSWFKPTAVLLAAWLPLIVGEPGVVHACPTHGAPAVASRFCRSRAGKPDGPSPRGARRPAAVVARFGARSRSPQLHLYQLLRGKR